MAPSTRALPSRTPIRRVAVAGAGIIVLGVMALMVVVALSDHAARATSDALAEQQQVVDASSGSALLLDRAAVFTGDKPLSVRAKAALAAAERDFAHVVQAAGGGAEAVDHRLLRRVETANKRLTSLEHSIQRFLGRPGSVAGLLALQRRRVAADEALDPFVSYDRSQASEAAAAALSAQRTTRLLMVVLGGLVLSLMALLGVYMVRTLRRHVARIHGDSQLLVAQVAELEEARAETLQRLALAAEYRDDDTLHHTERVGQLASLIAARMGLGPNMVELIRQAAPLHDVGKLGVSDTVLLKPGRLTHDEREQMKRHTAIGSAILAGSRSPVLALGQDIAHYHHECWDGSGYPLGIAGDVIPIAARIVAVADVFDALTHDRPYKSAWSVADAVAEIERLAGRQFEPRIVAAFRSLVHEQLSNDGQPAAPLAA